MPLCDWWGGIFSDLVFSLNGFCFSVDHAGRLTALKNIRWERRYWIQIRVATKLKVKNPADASCRPESAPLLKHCCVLKAPRVSTSFFYWETQPCASRFLATFPQMYGRCVVIAAVALHTCPNLPKGAFPNFADDAAMNPSCPRCCRCSCCCYGPHTSIPQPFFHSCLPPKTQLGSLLRCRRETPGCRATVSGLCGACCGGTRSCGTPEEGGKGSRFWQVLHTCWWYVNQSAAHPCTLRTLVFSCSTQQVV